MNLNTIKENLPKILQDKAGFLTQEDLEFFAKRAIEKFNRDKPKQLVWEFQGDGQKYIFELPSTFIPDFSKIISIEYPADIQPPSFLNYGDFQIISKLENNTLKHFLCFKWITPAQNKTIRVTYTTLRNINEEIPDEFLTPILYLAASLAFKSLAARFAESKEPTLEADIIDYRDKIRSYLELSREAENIYNSFIPKPNPSATIDWDTSYSFKHPFLFHKPWHR